LYIEQFQYVAAATEDRNAYIFDDDKEEGNDSAQSDFVRVVLNLGYMNNPENFDFLPSNLVKLKDQHDKLHDQEKGHALN
jgi:nitric oxide synthase oxygenase domain/subunit